MEKYNCLIHDKLLSKDIIKGHVVSLKLQGFYEVKDLSDLPHYVFFIMLGNQRIGSITLRLGFNQFTWIHGHIGYQIDTNFQGFGYSYHALTLILGLAKEHGYSYVLVTCEKNNLKSIKGVLKAGGRLVNDHVFIPHDHIYHILGYTDLNCYEISLFDKS